MADSNTAQERSEEPTEKRLRKAKEDGQVARSKELNTVVLLLLGICGLLWFATSLFQFFIELMKKNFQFDKQFIDSEKALPLAFDHALHGMLGAILPLLILLFIAMWLVGSLPGGAIFSTKLLQPKFSKLNPLTGLGRMFGSNVQIELLKSALKILLLGLCLVTFLNQLWERLLLLPQLELTQAILEGFSFLSLALIMTVMTLVLIAVVDIPFQKKQISSKVKMTKQEVKEERKSSDGSPELKSRIRQIQYQMANRKIEERVPKADVVITNPTHYAVAICYSAQKAKAPYVTAKGVDEMAMRIKEVAKHSGLEVVELPPLARAVYYSTRVDQEIPSGLYTAIAYVLTYVTQLKAYREGRGYKPAPIPTLKIPQELLKKSKTEGS